MNGFEARKLEPQPPSETVAVVVVTYNRAALLIRMLAGLAALERAPDAVIRTSPQRHPPGRQ